MNLFNGMINAVLRAFYAAFSWAPPILSLAILSVLVGIGMLWVYGKTSNQGKIRSVKRQLHALLLEMRVYADEPRITLRTQRSLLAANLRYMGLALRPALWMAIPIALLLVHLEAFYGRAPLPAGAETIVTAAIRGAGGAPPELLPPPGVEISAPPVRILDRGEVSWRVRPLGDLSGQLRFRVGGHIIAKTIEAGGRPRFIPGKSVRPVLSALWHPDQPRIDTDDVDWVEIRYPDADVGLWGIRLNWLVWFVIISMLAALALRKRFGVAI
jgi:uncharacterized membrane protein (DUF106 family)